jgi:deoxycytidine triphosphate deaminase
MYLIDKEIYEVLPDLNVETENPAYPFSAEQQVQPCSIDLRLSNVFWQAVSKSSIIDLRRSKLAEVSPRRHWRRVVLKPHESHTIRPGQIMLGRTYEKFSMPNQYAGKIEGRSSFSRMGLGVHCTGDFINPGWRGHMPLQLVNKGPYPIKVFPFLPLCQLMLIKLSDVPEHLYGTDRLQSKYMDDDGGPSYWWRDNRIKQLHQALNQQDITLAVQQEILQTIGVQEPEVLERFEAYVDKRPVAALESAEALLDRFAQTEERKRILDRIFKWAHAVPLALTGSLSIKLILEPPFALKHYIVWSITLLSLAVAARALTIKDLDYFGEKELRQLRLSSGKRGIA